MASKIRNFVTFFKPEGGKSIINKYTNNAEKRLSCMSSEERKM